jgi:outer membrane beta-barrel protein
MRSLLILALLHAAPAGAAVAAGPSLLLAQAPASPQAPAAAGDASSAPPSPGAQSDEPAAPGTAVPQPPPADAPATDAPTAEAQPPSDAPALAPEAIEDPAAQRLVSGAPLYNPNVAVHVVQKKRFADAGKNEVVLFPAVAQFNGKYTSHVGSALQYVYHLQENLALQVAGLYHWSTRESGFVEELRDKTAAQGLAASSLLLRWGATAGVEVTPFYGKFAFYDGILGQFSLVLSGGAGIGDTRVLLRPDVDREVDGGTVLIPARYADTGQRFLGNVGGGFRVQVGKRFAMRLEVRDLVYTARVDRVNGCSSEDLGQMATANGTGQDFAELELSGSCDRGAFDGTQEGTGDPGKPLREDIPLAQDLIAEPSSDVLNVVSFYAGFSILF